MLRIAKKLALPVGVAGAAVAGFLIYDDRKSSNRYNKPKESFTPPSAESTRSRQEMLQNLAKREYDILVVGGGATGAGVAFDAVSRGLATALLERDDFASGTSSRSTKLIHGGVRYLEKAFWQADYGQYLLVKEALAERSRFIDIAPHLSFPLPIMIPVYKWWQLPYYYAGVKVYDAIAGKANLESSYLLTRGRALQAFPMLNDDALKGAIVYYDGSHNDSRTCASLACTAADMGADVLNHVNLIGLEKNDQGKIIGARAVDKLNPDAPPIVIKSKCVVNATGPFTDALRQMDDPSARGIAVGSSGVHIVLPGYYCPKDMGLLDPATSDGRVIFFLPWQGSTIAGTTDRPCKIESSPVPSEEDIQFILSEVGHYINGKVEVHRDDVRAAWSGIRPLVKDPNRSDTQNLVRNHAVNVSPSGLVTIAGGKWTTFREMAEETVDTCIRNFDLKPTSPCRTRTGELKVRGGEGWYPLMYVDLVRTYQLNEDVARHLSENYGTRAFEVARLCEPSVVDSDGNIVSRDDRLAPGYPFIDGEILYGTRHEYAQDAVDLLARRMRLAFLDCEAAKQALPKVIETMGNELKWSEQRKKEEEQKGLEYLVGMGLFNQKTKNEDSASSGN